MEKLMTPVLRKVFLIVLALLILLLGMSYIFSPYKSYQNGFIKSSVKIESSCEAAFNYLGDSNHARDWSVFVDFIEALNKEEFADGQVGSKRMCYTKSDRTGFTWEEEVVERREGSYRRITCYNFQNLFTSSPDLSTEQIYEKIEEGCKLTFTLDFQEEPKLWDKLKMKFSAYRIKSIFDRNLVNIRKEILQEGP